jgi:hypothetical protein
MGRLIRVRTRIFNEAIAQVRQVAFLANLAQQIVSGGGRQRFSGVQHPDAMLIPERPHATGRAEGNLLTGAFQFQCVSWFQLQRFPHRLGDYHAACFINDDASVHIGIMIWVDPLINTIFLGFLHAGLILAADPKKGAAGW